MVFIKKGNSLIPLTSTVNIGNEIIEIPSIEDLFIDEYGVISWQEPNISKLKNFKPSLSYILDINGIVIETNTTYYDALQYLNDGNNYITIKVKISITDEGYNKQYYFSKQIVESV